MASSTKPSLLKQTAVQIARLITAIFGYRWLHIAPASLRSVIGVLANKGDNVVIGGVYNTSTVQHWSQCVGKDGKVVVIEAGPENVEQMKREYKGLDNVFFVAKAIWDSKTSVKFTVSDTEYQGWNRVRDTAIGGFPTDQDDTAHDIEVEADTIDNIAKDCGLSSVNVIYLTINDAQLKAAEGIDNILKNNRDLRMMMHSRTPYPANETAEILRDKGLKVSIKVLVRGLRRKDESVVVSIYSCF